MDKRIDERFRKPRRTKGTPFYVQRNYWAAGVIALGGLSWFLLELTPGVKKAKLWCLENLQNSEEYKTRVKHFNAAWHEPALNHLLDKARHKQAYKNEPESDSWFFNTIIKKEDEAYKSHPNPSQQE